MATKRMGKYELGRVLGSGSFSKVRLGTDSTTNELFAVKVIEKAQLAKQRLEDQLKREIAVLKTLRHKNIVSMKEVLQTSRHIYIVLELVEGGELFDYIVQNKRLSEEKARKYFQQLILSVRYCHNQNIAHRDLKPENLLLDKNDNIKISDFGLANLTSNADGIMNTICGTPNYVAPEVIRDQGYNGFTADVWSCGIILYVMMSGHQAFDDVNVKALFNKIERGEYQMSRHFSESAKDLISKILVVDVNRRYNINQIIAHPWFQVGFDPAELAYTDGVIDISTKDLSSAVGEVEDPRSPNEESIAVSGEDGFGMCQRMMASTLNTLSKGSLPAAPAGSTSPSTTTISPPGASPGSPPVAAAGIRGVMYRGKIENAMKDVLAALKTMAPNISTTKGEGPYTQEFKGFVNGRHGLITFVVEVTPTVVPNLVLLEAKKGRGDHFDFADLVNQLTVLLGDKVCSTPAS